MNIPKLRQQKTIKKCHGISWEDSYAWVHQEDILEVLKNHSKLNNEVKQYLKIKTIAILIFICLSPNTISKYPELLYKVLFCNIHPIWCN